MDNQRSSVISRKELNILSPLVAKKDPKKRLSRVAKPPHSGYALDGLSFGSRLSGKGERIQASMLA